MELRPDQRDRPLTVAVDVRECEALQLVPDGRVDAAAERLQRLARPGAHFVVPDGDQEVDLGTQADQSSPAASAPPPPGSSQLSSAVTIAPCSGRRSTSAKRTHSTCPTTAALTDPGLSALEKMMALVSVPPFESFYEENCDAVLRELRRLLGCDAEDAYQETFLRALRGYGRLRNADNLRAWG